MRCIRLAMGLVGMLGLSATAAADMAFYVGGGVGYYNIKVDSPLTDMGITCSGTNPVHTDWCSRNFQDSSAVWNVTGGVEFGKYFGIQGDYYSYSQAEDQIPINSGVNTDVTADAYELSVKPMLPLGEHFDVFARIGYNWYNIDVKRQYVKGQSDSNNSSMYAGGISFNPTPTFSIIGEYEVVNADNGDLNQTVLRLVYKFR